MNQKIGKAKDVSVYKNLLDIFGSYTRSFPCTGVDGLFDTLIDGGKKLLPKDGHALNILEHIICQYSAPDVVQRLLNTRFADLPVEIRPVSKKGNRHEIASWERSGIISDRVKDLIDFSGAGVQGRWSDIDGNKVTLIDM